MPNAKITKHEFMKRSDEIVKEIGKIGQDELFRLAWNYVKTGDREDPAKRIDESELRRFAESYARQAIESLIGTEGFMELFSK